MEHYWSFHWRGRPVGYMLDGVMGIYDRRHGLRGTWRDYATPHARAFAEELARTGCEELFFMAIGGPIFLARPPLSGVVVLEQPLGKRRTFPEPPEVDLFLQDRPFARLLRPGKTLSYAVLRYPYVGLHAETLAAVRDNLGRGESIYCYLDNRGKERQVLALDEETITVGLGRDRVREQEP